MIFATPKRRHLPNSDNVQPPSILVRYKQMIQALLLILLATGCTTPQPDLPDGITFQATDKPFWAIDWAPDSLRLVGSTPTVAHSATLEGPSEIYIWDPAEDSYLQVSDKAPSQNSASPEWHPQEDKIMYYSIEDFENSRIGVVTVNAEGLIRESILDMGNKAVWSPDGSIIGGGSTLYKFNMSTDERRLIWIVPSTQHLLALTISPDGQQMAILTQESGTDIYRLFLETIGDYAENELFTTSIRPQGLDWSPDGEWIMLFQFDKVYAVRVTDGCVTDGWNIEVEDRVRDVKWSPDGTQVAAAVILDRPHGNYGVLFIETSSSFFQDWLASGNCHASQP